MFVETLINKYYDSPKYVKTVFSHAFTFSTFLFSERYDLQVEKYLMGRVSSIPLSSKTLVKIVRICVFILLFATAYYSPMLSVVTILALLAIHRMGLFFEKAVYSSPPLTIRTFILQAITFATNNLKNPEKASALTCIAKARVANRDVNGGLETIDLIDGHNSQAVALAKIAKILIMRHETDRAKAILVRTTQIAHLIENSSKDKVFSQIAKLYAANGDNVSALATADLLDADLLNDDLKILTLAKIAHVQAARGDLVIARNTLTKVKAIALLYQYTHTEIGYCPHIQKHLLKIFEVQMAIEEIEGAGGARATLDRAIVNANRIKPFKDSEDDNKVLRELLKMQLALKDILGARNTLRDAIEQAKFIHDDYFVCAALIKIIEILLGADQIPLAIDTARHVTRSNEIALAYVLIAKARLAKNEDELARDACHLSPTFHTQKVFGIFNIETAKKQAANNEIKEASDLIVGVKEKALLLSEDSNSNTALYVTNPKLKKSQILRKIAKVYALMNAIQDARAIVDDILPYDEKIKALLGIVKVVRNP